MGERKTAKIVAVEYDLLTFFHLLLPSQLNYSERKEASSSLVVV